MTDTVVKLESVTKRYYLEKPKTLKKWFATLFSPFEKFTVIDNFSLEVKKGEFIFLSGPNGSGKTTLLKLIAGIIQPDEGTIKTSGRIVPLIELGAGFNNELTGRENMVINATILGLSRKKIAETGPEIIGFAGLKDFIDIPIKRFSSGMISRLAFSIAIHAEPDILLLDEIFAVGDDQFRKASLEKLKILKKKSKNVILCSHTNIRSNLLDRTIKLSSAKK